MGFNALYPLSYGFMDIIIMHLFVLGMAKRRENNPRFKIWLPNIVRLNH